MNSISLINTVLVAVFATVALVSCNAPVVSLTNDGQKIVMKSASGNVEPERFIAISKRQAQGQFVTEAYEQAVESLKKGDQQKAQNLVNLAKIAESPNTYIPITGSRPNTNSKQQLAQSEGKNYKSLKVANLSKVYTFEFLSGPLAGLVLAPGASSPTEYSLEIGTINMLYRLTDTDGKQVTKNFNFPITRTSSVLELKVEEAKQTEKSKEKVQKVAPAKKK